MPYFVALKYSLQVRREVYHFPGEWALHKRLPDLPQKGAGMVSSMQFEKLVFIYLPVEKH